MISNAFFIVNMMCAVMLLKKGMHKSADCRVK